MKKVIVDTSSIIYSFKLKQDIFSNLQDIGYTPVVLDAIYEELHNMASKKDRNSLIAKYAIRVIKDKKIKIERSKGKGDEALFNFAKKNKCAVCTNDKDLKKRIKNLSLEILSVKSNGFVGE